MIRATQIQAPCGDLYKERRQLGIAEHWVYFSCNVQEWEAYDPYRSRWMTLPRMPHNDCFMCSDKESLAVGTEVLVFGKKILSHIILSYIIYVVKYQVFDEDG
ncbi:F-box/kelch-repeat protein At1g74510-like isoform X2 [Phragmites australis]|uniref:F-box/kelch-repeat protein At1g74510-like isoform X2 n=1 Tax=Phragmites australis TaxID=29695 RepID=UPI002D7691B4|nr:F-box/kelch-repeat protein At1g74510-like isoform X2 [Phragmites australis]